MHDTPTAIAERALSTLEANSKRIAELEAALEPFALLASGHMPDKYPYPMVAVDLPGHPCVHANDFRRAAQAMGRALRKSTPST